MTAEEIEAQAAFVKFVNSIPDSMVFALEGVKVHQSRYLFEAGRNAGLEAAAVYAKYERGLEGLCAAILALKTAETGQG